MANDPEIRLHKEWLGFLQPVGLVVSPPALSAAQAVVNRNVVELQQTLATVARRETLSGDIDKETFGIDDFPAFTINVLGWQPEDLVVSPEELAIALPDYNEVLTPTYAVPDPNGGWMMLIQVLPDGTELDNAGAEESKSTGWHASPQSKFERLLKETKVYTGLLCNGTELRLVYAPLGESSGHLTFPVQAMCEVSGRLILGAMEMLLSADRLFNVPSDRRLSAILEKSRKYQNDVSIKLAEQVLEALWDLLRGFQIADATSKSGLVSEIATTAPQHIYGGLITVLLRLVFLLYAEDRGLMSQDAVYTRYYSVSGLYDRLREDAGNYPDTMDQRYGAWAWLLSLFRLVYDGGGHADLYLPARHGQLFDPDEYPFLEGRPQYTKYQTGESLEPPRVSDGVIHRVLQGLLVLDGERLSYRSLAVEQIGSVYEAAAGYEVERASSPAIGVWSKPKGSKSSVTVVVSVGDILKTKAGERAKYLKDFAGCEITGKSLTELKDARTPEDVVAALGRKVSPKTPSLMPVGSLYLQPGEERRRSGSHYTPRALTEPIVKETLRPILSALGENPTPEQILELKVCDLAMGSGAFLVESCRQLAEKLVEAWNKQNVLPEIPIDEEPLLYARRLVAQRCLYGVDKNPFAVNLAKLSLWLATLAKAHPFTFLDHALKWGDSLVGLTSEQIKTFTWDEDKTYKDPNLPLFNLSMDKAKFYRNGIHNLDEDNYAAKREFYKNIETELGDIRLKGDLVIASFFAKDKDKARKDERDNSWLKFYQWQKNQEDDLDVRRICAELRYGEKPVPAFNWEIEFPEVFDRENPGFDAIVGNPPFAGKNTTINAHASGYQDWLKVVNPESHGNADLVAHFFRRAFSLLRQSGCFGLIATNTIAQGDTRNTGLRYICENDGTIYNAKRRLKWPGLAAVVVSVIHVFKGNYQGVKLLDRHEVDLISAFLFKSGGNKNPAVLLANADKSFQGNIVLGMGFTFDNSNSDSTSIAEMHCLIENNPKNQERIFPYIGGEEVNASPTHAHHRYVINLEEMSENDARNYPDLMKIVEEKVKPERLKLGGNPDAERRKKNWWLWGRYTPALFKAIAPLNRVLLTNAQASTHLSFIFYEPTVVFANSLNVFPFQTYSSFAILQSCIHEVYARFFSSSLEDRLRYNPSDCFETFPFPENWETNPILEAVGKTYYEYRAALMVRNNQGLTDTYNRFHDPDERHPDILQLRLLHAQMDRAVLDAYGWIDISTDCTFLLDYEDEEDDENTSKRQKKKPWRYRWPEEIHDEVLARLLELNQQRAEAEILGGKAAEKSKAKGNTKKVTKSRKAKATITTPNIPGLSE
ncbi:Eco57I restriction-modification methylase domain-containing protein [Nostoc sp. 'Peltigera membranacea cyanobiont' N6]|uniref:Eco57I restriction-modification methylase domain-containing protein n=1 Tax=Nostoc sp. 'Peltigera membranacea cyanobiont' N6 TaxID=1261031 RepID=UPI000CF3145B|nr:DNA methyltransferase [Nostoc sp. 'Peltigera membranacea cyanobiont' N6]AVH68333.1 type II restriction-modification system methyltransferase [Nostoc sp. 'Peltigera membranacea cyanobiont' N6]